MKSTDLRTHMRRRLRRAAFVLVLGFAILLAGLIALDDPARTAVGMIGFVVMVGALLLAMTAWKRLQPGAPDLHVVDGPERPARQKSSGRSGKSRPAAGGCSGGMKVKLEERWKCRREERGGDR